MAEGFDKVKAASDIKQLLKLNDGRTLQDEVKQNARREVSTRRKRNRAKKTKSVAGKDIPSSTQENGIPDRSSETHININSNALVTLTADYSPATESKQQSPRSSPVLKGHQQVLKLQKHDSQGNKCNEIRQASSESSLMKDPEIPRNHLPKVLDNAHVERLSDVKNDKKSAEGVKNPTDPSNLAQKVDPSVHLRNSSGSIKQKSHELLKNSAQGMEKARNGSSSGTCRDGERGVVKIMVRNNGQSPIDRRVENHSSKVNDKPLLAKPEEMDLSPEFLDLLEKNHIHHLKKKSIRYPKARFFCRLCDYHLDLKEDCDRHIKESRHCRRKEINEMDADLRNMDKPTEKQIAALTAAVEKLSEEHGIDEWEQKQRADVVSRLGRVLKEKIPDVVVFMYGSSLTGFGLKTSDINVDLTSTDKDKKLPYLLRDTFLYLKDKPGTGFSNVRSDFAAKIPGLLLTDDSTGLTVNVTIHCYSAHCSSELLSIYSHLDARVKKLAVAFRYWAHLCGLDRQSDGFIPPQALNIMVIYFLQNISPKIVQVIQPPNVTGDEVGDFRNDAPKFEKLRSKALEDHKACSSSNTRSVGELWLELLRFYSLEFDTPNVVVSIRGVKNLPRSSKPWNSKKLAVEDPYMLKKNITRMVSNSRIYEYWQDSIRKAYHYFGKPYNKDGKTDNPADDVKDAMHSDKEKGKDAGGVCETSGTKESSRSISSRKDVTAGKKEETREDNPGPVVIASNPLLSHSVVSSGVKDVPKQEENQGHKPQVPSNEGHRAAHLGNESESGSVDICHMTNQLSVNESDVIKNKPPLASCSTNNHDREASLDFSDSATVSGSTVEPSHQFQHGDLPAELRGSSGDVTSEGSPQHLDRPDCPQNLNSPDIHELGKDYAHFIVSKAISEMTKDALSYCLCENNKDSDSSVEKGCSLCAGHGDEVPHTTAFPTAGEVTASTKTALPSSICDTHCNHEVSSHVSSEFMDNHTAEHADPSVLNVKVSSDTSTNETTEDEFESKVKEELPAGKKNVPVMVQEDFHYEFSQENLSSGKGPTLVCSFCEKEGHLKNECPEDELPEILPLPKLTPFHVKVLSETLSRLPATVGLSMEGLAERVLFMRNLEDFIRVQFKDANLVLFGSSVNGFGFDQSDMDICLTFSERQVNDKSQLIENLARKMKQHRDLTNVQPIPTAKVPIVKFTVKKTGLEGDISLSNILAQQNTKLLYRYSQIDPRVRILGYTIKTFAKVCDIGDASRGSLSSYAYILMMLYYLQQVSPPVIPVLQELYKGKEKPRLMIEGCDAWFMDDLSQLEKLWPEKGKNKMSVAELWLGFLCFYVEKFNYKEYVVSIRQKELLTRFEKLWNGACITIEDPFDLSHNLGSGLTRKMNNFIFKTFINGRMLYGSPVDENKEMFNKYQSASDYFFDTDLLSECRPPNVRGCRRCGKIGHLVRHCPAARRDKEDEQKRLQQQQQQQQYSPQLQGQPHSAQKQQQKKQPQHQQQHLQSQHQKLSQQQHHRHSQPQQQNLQPQQHQRPAQQQRQPTQQHSQQQRNQLQKQQIQQQKERERHDRRDQDLRQNDPVSNTNRNSSAPTGVPAPLLFNLINHPNLQPTTPAALRGLQPQVFHNRSFPQQYQQQQFQQHSVVSSPGHDPPPASQSYVPQTLPTVPRNSMNAFGYAPMPQARPDTFHQLGYPQISPSWYPQNNNSNQRRLQVQTSAQSSNYSSDVNNANSQGMTPVVQNLFASARGQVLDASSNKPQRRK